MSLSKRSKLNVAAYIQFGLLPCCLQNSGAEQELIDAFRVFDTRGNGRLKATEVSETLVVLILTC